MASVFVPDKNRLNELGFRSVAHVPVIFESGSRYSSDLNRYLRERATLDWTPPGSNRKTILVHRSLLTIAYNLVNFLEWCEACRNADHPTESSRADWRTLTYNDVLAYQREQCSGAWSHKNRRLKPATANARADLATDFLTWASARGLRPPFKVQLTPARQRSKSETETRRPRKEMLVRVGREKESRSRHQQLALDIPTIEEVRDWLRAVRERRGYAKYLACRLIIEAGPRLHEIVAITEDQWPTSSEIERYDRQGHSATVELFVTKGSVPRTVMIPIPLAREVRIWLDGSRLRLAYLYHKRTKMRAPNQLFISDRRDHEGIPIQRHTLQDCFREVRPRPIRWSPHLGRHAFACFFVLHALELDAKVAGRSMADLGADWVTSRGDWWLKVLRRQLGHVSEDTTEIYLTWLRSATQLASLANGWHEYLNSEEC